MLPESPSYDGDLLASSYSTSMAADIYVNTGVDGAVNVSHCDSNVMNQASESLGECSLRSAVAACEDLLQTPAIALCSVHLPAQGLITMEPEWGEVQITANVLLNGTLTIIGNGCFISPNTNGSAVSSMRFLRIAGLFNDLFLVRVSNMTLSRFGSELLDGGVILVQDMLSEDSTRLEDIVFLKNVGRNGGALSLDESIHVTISACAFMDNTAEQGGALYLSTLSSHAALTACSFMDNAAYDGGGVYVESRCDDLKFTQCNFVNNTGTFGAGIYINGGRNNNMTISSSFFANNSALYGAGLYVNSEGNDFMTLQDLNFTQNTAILGGGMFVSNDNSFMSLISCHFTGNSVLQEGGGLYIFAYNHHMTLRFCTFTGNRGGERGGGLFLSANNNFFTLTSCAFSDNFVSEMDGSLNNFQRRGGAMYIYNDNDDVTLSFCSFTNNYAAESGEVFFWRVTMTV